MSLTFAERMNSRRYELRENDQSGITRIWHVPVQDPVNATSFGPAIGDLYLDMKCVSVTAEPIDEDMCILTATYEKQIEPDESESLFELDMSAQTENVKVALSQSWRPNQAKFDVGNLLNVDDKELKGHDVYTPRFTYRQTVRRSSMSDAAIKLLYTMAATVNDAGWKIFAAGECLFLGAQVRQEAADRYQLTYSFIGSPNKTFNVELISGATVTVHKIGWDYVWYAFGKEPEGGVLKKGVTAVYYSRVYQRTNFATLGIGT